MRSEVSRLFTSLNLFSVSDLRALWLFTVSLSGTGGVSIGTSLALASGAGGDAALFSRALSGFVRMEGVETTGSFSTTFSVSARGAGGSSIGTLYSDCSVIAAGSEAIGSSFAVSGGDVCSASAVTFGGNGSSMCGSSFCGSSTSGCSCVVTTGTVYACSACACSVGSLAISGTSVRLPIFASRELAASTDTMNNPRSSAHVAFCHGLPVMILDEIILGTLDYQQRVCE
mmetsp:Transcript_33261/g.55774  ORF Transcript_33261/g.55774 Transcript_33261/m.55774 type:complete len:229 (+) Transcript_33261:577-1263(+)